MGRFAGLAGIALVAMGVTFGVHAAQDTPKEQATSDLSGLHDFDFLFGEWRVHSRRLKARLTGSHDWEEFEGSIVSRKYMDGWANVDDTLHEDHGALRAGFFARWREDVGSELGAAARAGEIITELSR